MKVLAVESAEALKLSAEFASVGRTMRRSGGLVKVLPSRRGTYEVATSGDRTTRPSLLCSGNRPNNPQVQETRLVRRQSRLGAWLHLERLDVFFGVLRGCSSPSPATFSQLQDRTGRVSSRQNAFPVSVVSPSRAVFENFTFGSAASQWHGRDFIQMFHRPGFTKECVQLSVSDAQFDLQAIVGGCTRC